MNIKLAVYGTRENILIQAEKGLIKISRESELNVKITLFRHLTDFIEKLQNFDIAVVYENDFYVAIPEITSFYESKINKNECISTVVLGMFSVPIDMEKFLVLVDNIPKQSNTVDIPIANGCKTEIIENIICFENLTRRVYLKTKYESYQTKLTMKDAKVLLSTYPFESPYVSYIVNLGWVESIKGRDVILKNRDIIPLSQKKASQFKQQFRDYLSKML